MRYIKFALMIFILISITYACSAENLSSNDLSNNDKHRIHIAEFTLENFVSFARYSDMVLVKEAINRRIDVNSVNGKGYTALMWAAKNDDVEMTKLLLNNGATPDVEGLQGKTALLWAVHEGSINVIPLLIEAGADPYKVDHDNQGLLAYALIGDTIKSNDNIPDILLLLHNENIQLRHLPFNEEFTFLAATLSSENPKLIEVALLTGANLELYRDADQSRLTELRETTYLTYSSDPNLISNAKISLCLLNKYTNLPVSEIYSNNINTKEERIIECENIYRNYDYTLIESAANVISETPGMEFNLDNGENNNIDIESIVNRLLEEKLISVKGNEFIFGETLSEQTIFDLFGKPDSITEGSYTSYEYSDFRISLYEGVLISVAYYYLPEKEDDILSVLGKPDIFEEKNIYNQTVLTYLGYFDGEDDPESYITLDFIFHSDGSLDYFVIN